MMEKIGLYPGSFDPLTNGHVDIIKRASKIFDRIVVGIGINTKKTPLFTFDERREMIVGSIADALPGTKNFIVESFDGLLVDFAKHHGACAIIRGLRNGIDFSYEFELAHVNTRMCPDIEHVYFMTSEKDHFVSSSIIKEIWGLGGNYYSMVPHRVRVALESKKK